MSKPRGFENTSKDLGIDGGGVYRNIARENRIPDILSNGNYSTLSWAEICKHFSTKANEDRVQACIVDTVVFDRGDVIMYLFTNVDGFISKRPKSMLSFEKIYEQFLIFATAISPEKNLFVAFCHSAGKLPVAIDTDTLTNFLRNRTIPLDAEVLQCFIPSKSDPSFNTTYRTDYWLDRNARSILKTIRVGVSQDVSGSKSRSSTPNMNRRNNKYMESICESIVNRLQERLQCKIVRLTLNFVEDTAGKLWLSHSSECLYACEQNCDKKSLSPNALRMSRSTAVIQNSKGSVGVLDSRPAHTVGRFSNERISLRSAKQESHLDDAYVEDVLSGSMLPPKLGRRVRGLSPVRVGRSRGSSAELRPPSVGDVHAHLSADTRLFGTALDTSVFGSTQLNGCKGDFCKFEFAVSVADKDSDITAISKSQIMSEFRQKLMNTKKTGLGNNSEGAGAADEAEVSFFNNKTSTADAVEVTHNIPYRIIIQARQEMNLVNRLLRNLHSSDSQLKSRRKKAEHMYVTEDNYQDLAVSGKLPSHYYQDVGCCESCFRIYSLIAEARKSAIAVLERKRAESTSPQRHRGAALYLENSTDSWDGKQSQRRTFDLEASTIQNVDDNASLLVAVNAIESLNKLDVAEIRTMSKPPPAVTIVMEAVIALLTGKILSFQETRRLLGGGEAFLLMLREFRLENLTDARLKLVEPYVDNPLFRPENVQPSSYCASKFCSWVLGVVQAARWQRGAGHIRTDLIRPSTSIPRSPIRESEGREGGGRSHKEKSLNSLSNDELTFVQKLERKKAKKLHSSQTVSCSLEEPQLQFSNLSRKAHPSPLSFISRAAADNQKSHKVENSDASNAEYQKTKKIQQREAVALIASQKKASERLSSLNKSDSNATTGSTKFFRCFDGITKMPYTVLGSLSLEIKRCNFIIVHDFFDTCDGTAIAMRPIAQRHNGCQVLCFNYPGQANTVWPRPTAIERQRGAKEQILNNEWIADRLHELLQHAEEEGDILLTNPFHLVAIGNGAAIAAAFALKYGQDALYSGSLRSLVSINGLLYPDPQLTSILHSAAQVFESTPHSRPDIPISYWSRFVFSEDYLSRINPGLALNIYTAVSNPITNEGRSKIAKGCLMHKDLRGMMGADRVIKTAEVNQELSEDGDSLHPLTVPIFILQSTENMLVNASNVDPFLSGRHTKHLWSHQLNMMTNAKLSSANDTTALWVGKLSHGPEDYSKFSILGKTGLKMLLETTSNPRGAFVIWIRAGHAIMQENKSAVLDLLDSLACPSEEYCGISLSKEKEKSTQLQSLAGRSTDDYSSIEVVIDDTEVSTYRGSNNREAILSNPEDVDSDIMFRLQSPAKSSSQIDAGDVADVEAEDKESFEEMSAINISSSNAQTQPTVSTAKSRMELEKLVKSEPVVVHYPDNKPAFPNRIDSSTNKKTKNSKADDGGRTRAGKTENNVIGLRAEDTGVKAVERSANSASSDIYNHHSSPKINNTSSPMSPGPSPSPGPSAFTSISSSSVGVYLGSDEGIMNDSKSVSQNNVAPPTLSSEGKDLQVKLQKKFEDSSSLERVAKLEKEKKNQEDRLARIEREQDNRRSKFKAEDDKLLSDLDRELDARRLERDKSEKLRLLEIQRLEQSLVARGVVPSYEPPAGASAPVLEMADMKYNSPGELPSVFYESKDVVSSLDRMAADEIAARKKGIMSMEEYEKVKSKMLLAQLDRDQTNRHMDFAEQARFKEKTVMTIQRYGRGYNGRKKATIAARDRELQKMIRRGVISFQAVIRGIVGRKRASNIRRIYLANIMRGDSVVTIQRFMRGYFARKFYKKLRRNHAAKNMQRAFRGHLGRMTANRERARLALLKMKQNASIKIQSSWRMKVAKEEFRSMRIHVLAAIELQRCYRGYLGRKVMKRRREWESAKPGPERIKLGLKMIEESKVAFERQQEEIDALHRAQERAEARVSHIHAELKDSEKELIVLERELQEIDQIERDLQNMTHERDILLSGIRDAAGLPRTAVPGHENTVLGKEPTFGDGESAEGIRRKKAEAYALELTIQIKRAEREKKRQELETEFASVFQEVEKKRRALERLESSLADMESTRERKDREFRRLQKNLMQLLLEQKQELDELREKGIELETATATTAAAATATAQKAKEHEKRSTVMFSQTEELMKFQFMSMSLSYFSSLNMLKQLRDMNSDTTSAAVASSADAAAAAAAAATAANLPNMKKLNLGADDFVTLNIHKKKAELEASEKAEKEVREAQSTPFPSNVKMWSVDDVLRWLESLSLAQYGQAFREATVDGPFLMELREEDLIQVLGVSHKLHVRKIIISREKLKPLSEQELARKAQVEHEEMADQRRKMIGVPDLDTVFSQARNGRLKRLEESLNQGFPIDTEDPKGNTLLLIAAQNSNKRILEVLVARGASVNHQNAQGNTALHFAMSFDKEGTLAEYLISNGADDTIENVDGLTAYDGVK